MPNISKAPVLFLVFSRPDLTKDVFECIREQRPDRLYVAADGPRSARDGESKLCETTRKITEEIDWKCEVKRLYRNENLGCREAVSSAIDWFFDHEEAGIILEDDCLPEQSFFRFAAEMLERYADDERIFSVSGNNFQPTEVKCEGSYYFSLFPHIWGWATWRRAWRHYDVTLDAWPASKTAVSSAIANTPAVEHFKVIFDDVRAGLVDTWDYQMLHCSLARQCFNIIPAKNLVSNIGFDVRATHTFSSDHPLAVRATCTMDFPLKHPDSISRNLAADRYTIHNIFHINGYSIYWLRKIRRFFRAIASALRGGTKTIQILL